ncbi:MAG: hypothetical protein IT379_22975 [Deltaproteobacteria bacterium]|nr:hypothetical protein [Deltaproteobacteria bacterium]
MTARPTGAGVALAWRRIGPGARCLAVVTPHVVIGGDDWLVRVTLDGSSCTTTHITDRAVRAVAATDGVAAWTERDTGASWCARATRRACSTAITIHGRSTWKGSTSSGRRLGSSTETP